MSEQIYILPYLRKGLSNFIKESDVKQAGETRAQLDFAVEVQGNIAGGNTTEKNYLERSIQLVGPADVKSISKDCISQINPPSSKTVSRNYIYMPFIEFFEEDLPWRYSPVAVNEEQDSCLPWLVLIAVKEGEFTTQFNQQGRKTVTLNINEKRRKEIFPTTEEFHNLAHVQIVSDTPVNRENVDEILSYNPDKGISRLLCASKLEEDAHYTVFLLPAFEIGRLSGLGQSTEGSFIDDISWNKGATEFPIYHQWDFFTSKQGGNFKELADKLHLTADYNFTSSLSVDISESGLETANVKEEESVIDVHAALKINEKGYKKKINEEPAQFRTALKEELELSPVFQENKTGEINTNEDPWIVPPVYGARHMVSTGFHGDVVEEVNLKLQNRIPAGMGSSVVKKNQEYFVNRAWKKVEKINELNKIMREYYQMHKVNETAEKKVTKKDDNQFNTQRLVVMKTDLPQRTLQASGIFKKSVNADTLKGTLSEPSDNLFVPTTKLVQGITEQEIDEFFSPHSNSSYKYWEDILGDENKELRLSVYLQWQMENFKKNNPLIAPLFTLCYKGNSYYFQKSSNISRALPQTNENFISANGTMLVSQMYMGKWKKNLKLNTVCHLARSVVSHYKPFFNIDSYYTGKNASLAQMALPIRIEKEIGFVFLEEIYRKVIRELNPNLNTNELQDGFAIKCESKEKDEKGNIQPLERCIYFLPYSKVKEMQKVVSYKDDNASSQGQEEDSTTIPINYIDNKFVSTRSVYTLDVGLGTINNNDRTYIPEGTNLLTDNSNYRELCTFIEALSSKRTYTVNYYIGGSNIVIASIRKKSSNELVSTFRIVADGSLGITIKDRKAVVDLQVFLPALTELKYNLESIDNFIWQPNQCVINKKLLESLERKSISASDLITYDEVAADKKIKGIPRLVQELTLDFVTPKEVCAPNDSIDPDAEGKKKIDEILAKYGYTEDNQIRLERLKRNATSKYPVMAYPEFLDPTYYYLRQLNEKYILPGVNEIAMNSITMFQSNPNFEEAFLMGMNTEMGQELLWREYPTDQRGSYFRKFWDQQTLPDKKELETKYYDVKELHEWKGALGKNHTSGKGNMLVFAIKGELMQVFPKTNVYLSSIDNNGNVKLEHEASMASWLSTETYLVGFEGLNQDIVTGKGWNLTFQQDIGDLQFELSRQGALNGNATEYAVSRVNDPFIFAIPL